eukprot:GSMAST32.ASY1.ANO1.2216.1 assembled CDS
MKVEKNWEDPLLKWLVYQLNVIGVENTQVLSEYTLKLLQKDLPIVEHKQHCVVNMKPFMENKDVESFVDLLFNVMDTRAFFDGVNGGTSSRVQDTRHPVRQGSRHISDDEDEHHYRRTRRNDNEMSDEYHRRSRMDKRRVDWGNKSRPSGSDIQYHDSKRRRTNDRNDNGWQQCPKNDGRNVPNRYSQNSSGYRENPNPNSSGYRENPNPNSSGFRESNREFRSSPQSVDFRRHTPLSPSGEVFYKTKLCDNYRRTGSCKFENRCNWAHGEKDLRKPNFAKRGDLNSNSPNPSTHYNRNNLRRESDGTGNDSYPKSHNQQYSTNSNTITTLLCRKVDPKYVNMGKICAHFGKFGNVINVQMKPKSKCAYIQFESRAGAERAFKSPQSVCNNRFITVCFVYSIKYFFVFFCIFLYLFL